MNGNPSQSRFTRLWRAGITQVHEVIPRVNNATSTFSYDYENRLTAYAIGASNFSAAHTYDGYNRLVKTDATIGANTQNFEHVYSGKQHLGNIEVTGTPGDNAKAYENKMRCPVGIGIGPTLGGCQPGQPIE